ncbi:hypothetical protein FLM05_18560 [Vibrio cholerae]|nr:hypothetical protein FLM05_18560 [Vibrio cholerae]TQP01791.1 hypothetical protein FLM07_13110 [Vibrio cholerae]TQP62347.1 hypothetical protein FLL95_03260 [Vibrio cholerae]TQP97112.1 hypothetical protein FLL77_11090 [Vibrio cholerae]
MTFFCVTLPKFSYPDNPPRNAQLLNCLSNSTLVLFCQITDLSLFAEQSIALAFKCHKLDFDHLFTGQNSSNSQAPFLKSIKLTSHINNSPRLSIRRIYCLTLNLFLHSASKLLGFVDVRSVSESSCQSS